MLGFWLMLFTIKLYSRKDIFKLNTLSFYIEQKYKQGPLTPLRDFSTISFLNSVCSSQFIKGK